MEEPIRWGRSTLLVLFGMGVAVLIATLGGMGAEAIGVPRLLGGVACSFLAGLAGAALPVLLTRSDAIGHALAPLILPFGWAVFRASVVHEPYHAAGDEPVLGLATVMAIEAVALLLGALAIGIPVQRGRGRAECDTLPA